MDYNKNKTALVTGAAGFIGYHISKQLLAEGWHVVGVDCLSDYYDVNLKKSREAILQKNSNYSSVRGKIETKHLLMRIFEKVRPKLVIHLAAQAGVRYSIENPRAYLDSNILGSFELLEAARSYPPQHVIMASSSSVYGSNLSLPFRESDKCDNQVSVYAATKKSTENIAHSYAKLFDLPITMCRFFTVYGPWGRPDMALFKFTKLILEDKKIDVYNNGNLCRDFTYIDDVVQALMLLKDAIPNENIKKHNYKNCTNSLTVAPFRVVNVGNSKKVRLIDFIHAIETATGVKSKLNHLPMQAGDVTDTWADTKLLEEITGFKSQTDIKDGVSKFVKWYRNYYEE